MLISLRSVKKKEKKRSAMLVSDFLAFVLYFLGSTALFIASVPGGLEAFYSCHIFYLSVNKEESKQYLKRLNLLQFYFKLPFDDFLTILY